MQKLNCHIDPLCPWAWLTSRWLVRLQELNEVEVDWRLFSLGLANLPADQEPPPGPVGSSGPALALLALARRQGGNQLVGRLYTTLGTAIHQDHLRISETETLERALSQAGMDPALASGVSDEPTLWEEVAQDHQTAVDSCQAFGVPTLILDGGRGPGLFGPVITRVPDDDECRELLRDVVRMARRDYLFEIKRDRDGHPPELQPAVG